MLYEPQKIEQKILKFWKQHKVFEKSVTQRSPKRRFVFYEGPPTANGQPGIHHVLARAFKDVVCRYKTMAGFRVERKAGWDTHGLPVELEVEKELGFTSKSDIERYGIERFNALCKKSVWKYKSEWEKLTTRIGFWLDMEHPYITYEAPYMETVWGIIKEIWKKGLLYQDYKVVPHCPRCGTTLSSHEVALGYRRIKENSIYVRFPVKNVRNVKAVQIVDGKQAGRSNNFNKQSDLTTQTSLLVWTTTPWTLPGNVAVAVQPELTYVLVEVKGERLILAKDRLSVLGKEPYAVSKEFKGKELVGLGYEPPFRLFEVSGQKLWYVVSGSFVTTDEGTGLVHIAPAFGEQDMELSKINDLPVFIPVDENGRFNPHESETYQSWAGQFVKDLDPTIAANLARRGLLFREELYEHDYPFCWRCGTPLLYYAKQSWFIRMSQLRQKLIDENKKINWIPAHLQQGRFGEWLKEVKDWAVSRERYWGVPLPVWQCQKCQEREVIGSLKELRSKKFSSNRYIIMRHGEARSNVEGFIASWPEKRKNSLTARGFARVRAAAKELKKERIDLLLSSDLTRCRETSEIVAKEIGLAPQYDKRLREFDLGSFNGQPNSAYEKFEGSAETKFTKRPPGGENWHDVRRRMVAFIERCERRFARKTILIVSHGDPLWLLKGAMSGMTDRELAADYERNGYKAELSGKKTSYPQKAVHEHLHYAKLPRDKNGSLDLHRPFADAVKYICRCGGIMGRIPDVLDVWFDSGAMPWAQYAEHIGELKVKSQKLKVTYPAEFICEAIDQTRGWFYTLLAIGVLLDHGTPYRNVISLGHVLDRSGKKMSKSLGNIVDPVEIIARYGADAVRWYFFTLNQPGEPKRFDEQELRASYNRFIVTLWNIFQFWGTYAERDVKNVRIVQIVRSERAKRTNNFNKRSDLTVLTVLDRWILSRLQSVTGSVRTKMDAYDVVGASRDIEHFVLDDLSNWYVRRSRERFQHPENRENIAAVSGVLAEVLQVTIALAAPFIPFTAEHLFHMLSGNTSVHLAEYPIPNTKLRDAALEQHMARARALVEAGLAARATAKIKVRQKLASLAFLQPHGTEVLAELFQFIQAELNVETVRPVPALPLAQGWLTLAVGEWNVALDTRITPRLREEGLVRELSRIVQEMRKEIGLKPSDTPRMFMAAETLLLKDILQKSRDEIRRTVRAKELVLRVPDARVVRIDRETTIGEEKVRIAIQ